MLKQQKFRRNNKSFPQRNSKYQTLLISNSNRRFEFVYFIFFRKWLRYFFKKSKRRKTNIFCYICLVGNYFLSKKTKNSRMGKGNGGSFRKCILIRKNQPILITSGIQIVYLYKFKKLIEKKLNFCCSIQTNFILKKSLIFSARYTVKQNKKKLKF